MFKLDSGTKYILFIFLLMLLIIIYAYDDDTIKYSYQKSQNKQKNILPQEMLNNQYYIYNQTTFDDIYPSYI